MGVLKNLIDKSAVANANPTDLDEAAAPDAGLKSESKKLNGPNGGTAVAKGDQSAATDDMAFVYKPAATGAKVEPKAQGESFMPGQGLNADALKSGAEILDMPQQTNPLSKQGEAMLAIKKLTETISINAEESVVRQKIMEANSIFRAAFDADIADDPAFMSEFLRLVPAHRAIASRVLQEFSVKAQAPNVADKSVPGQGYVAALDPVEAAKNSATLSQEVGRKSADGIASLAGALVSGSFALAGAAAGGALGVGKGLVEAGARAGKQLLAKKAEKQFAETVGREAAAFVDFNEQVGNVQASAEKLSVLVSNGESFENGSEAFFDLAAEFSQQMDQLQQRKVTHFEATDAMLGVAKHDSQKFEQSINKLKSSEDKLQALSETIKGLPYSPVLAKILAQDGDKSVKGKIEERALAEPGFAEELKSSITKADETLNGWIEKIKEMMQKILSLFTSNAKEKDSELAQQQVDTMKPQ